MSLARGSVWLADLSPTRGREQAGRRPVVILSHGIFNQGPSNLVIVCPMTTRERDIRTHIRVEASEGGIRETSFIMTEAIRSISKDRLLKHWGHLGSNTVINVESVLKVLLDL